MLTQDHGAILAEIQGPITILRAEKLVVTDIHDTARRCQHAGLALTQPGDFAHGLAALGTVFRPLVVGHAAVGTRHLFAAALLLLLLGFSFRLFFALAALLLLALFPGSAISLLLLAPLTLLSLALFAFSALPCLPLFPLTLELR